MLNHPEASTESNATSAADHLRLLPDNAGYSGAFEHFRVEGNRIKILTTDANPRRRGLPHFEKPNELLSKGSDDSKRWRRILGRLLASEVFGLAQDELHPVWTLSNFPGGYALWAVNYSEDKRSVYLYGSELAAHRYRSPAEFVPHAKWLMSGMPHKGGSMEPTCGCIYCTKRPNEQKRVTKQLKEGYKAAAGGTAGQEMVE